MAAPTVNRSCARPHTRVHAVPSTHFGRGAMKASTFVLVVALVGCGAGREKRVATETNKTGQALTVSEETELYPWGGESAQIGLVPAAPERAAFGAPAIAVGPRGDT